MFIKFQKKVRKKIEFVLIYDDYIFQLFCIAVKIMIHLWYDILDKIIEKTVLVKF